MANNFDEILIYCQSQKKVLAIHQLPRKWDPSVTTLNAKKMDQVPTHSV